jgi:RNA polymerase sigma-70 factor (ECF subfamily)
VSTVVTRLAIDELRSAARSWGISLRREGVNGQPGAVALDAAGRLIGVIALDIADGRIQAISSLINPDKLDHLGIPIAPGRSPISGEG